MQETQSRALLDAKLALEAEINQPLYLALRLYIHAYLEGDGQVTPLVKAEHQQRIETILRRHYARVAMVVTGRKPPYNPGLDQAALSLRHGHSMAKRAKDQAKLLLGTIDRAFKTAQADPSLIHDDGIHHHGLKSADLVLETKQDTQGAPKIEPSYIVDLVNIAKAIADKLKSRMAGIANVQTNGPAEEARAEDAQQQIFDKLEVVPDDQANVKLIKIWHNVGDARVRGAPHNPRSSAFDHWTCEGQERAVEDPFLISGELLRFPADSELGASLGNTINCRCYVSNWAVHPDGTREHIYTSPSAPAKKINRKRPVGKQPDGTMMPEHNPTSVIELYKVGNRRQVILGNHQLATVSVVSPNVVTVSIGRATIGRAEIANGQITSVVVAPSHANAGVEDLLQRLVKHNAKRW
jgi:phage tail protein X